MNDYNNCMCIYCGRYFIPTQHGGFRFNPDGTAGVCDRCDKEDAWKADTHYYKELIKTDMER